MAENAVDNGIKLKIRRPVVNIQRHDDFLELTVNHWEPKPYADSMNGDHDTSSSNVSFVLALLGGMVAGIAYSASKHHKQL